MDRALSKYRGIQSPSAWVDDAIALATICRDVEGLWVGLWHPNLTAALGYPGAPEEYERLLRRVVEDMQPYVGTAGDLVRWRRARRLVRARHVAPDGRLELDGVSAIALEDSSGARA